VAVYPEILTDNFFGPLVALNNAIELTLCRCLFLGASTATQKNGNAFASGTLPIFTWSFTYNKHNVLRIEGWVLNVSE
jgi:hypothetical protein